MALLSIIIPCYNDGKYLTEALDSVKSLREKGLAEVIIVDDGSDDAPTQSLLKALKAQGWNIHHQENKGLSAARNAGIRKTNSKYLLPLDCDNMIIDDYVADAVKLLEQDNTIDILYSDFLQFGDTESYYKAGEFDICRLISSNFIDACSVYRRAVWEKLGGYDEKIDHGNEDWDLWVRASLAGMTFRYNPKPGFRYRVRTDSLLRTQTREKGLQIRRQVYEKHNLELFESIRRNFVEPEHNYKAKYLDLQSQLKNNKLRNLVKILLGRDFY